ncbi:hypothetical protein Tco_1277369, partial [Tanacetum coccineum]
HWITGSHRIRIRWAAYDAGGPICGGRSSCPPSPDYMSGLEELQAPPPLDFVLELVYPEFMPPEDDVFLAEEQPLSATVSPTAELPNRDDDDEEEESSRDETDDEEEDEDEDEEEEHPALADSIPPPPHAYRVTARMSIRPHMPVPFLYEEEAERFLAMPTLPPSPLTPLSLPLPQIPSLPLPVSPPLPASPTHPLGYRAAMIRLRAKAPSTSHLLPLPPPIILFHTISDAPPLGTPLSGTPPLLPIPAPTS